MAGGLAGVGLNQGSRLIVEKPFGRDLASALELNDTLHEFFDEEAIFRIDHFLGKEAMRSLLITRFANAILEPLWRRTHVQSVKITMAESFGVEDRGAFYDSVGALRDVMQNHLLQMVALFAMEQPVNEHSKSLRDEKAKVLQAARPVDPAHYVRGQYRGYRSVEGVAPDSDTETFGAFRLDFDSPRWGGVPFFLRAGKSMAETVTEMTIEFAPPPRPLWISEESHLPPNRIRIEAKPDSFTALTWLRKSPGDQMLAEPITLSPPPELRGDIGPEPYELLIEDAMAGDPTLFAREDSIEESWRIVEPILTEYPKVVEYARGHVGPGGGARHAARTRATGLKSRPVEHGSGTRRLGAAPRGDALGQRRAPHRTHGCAPGRARGGGRPRRWDGCSTVAGSRRCWSARWAGRGPRASWPGTATRPRCATTCWSGTTATTRA